MFNSQARTLRAASYTSFHRSVAFELSISHVLFQTSDIERNCLCF